MQDAETLTAPPGPTANPGLPQPDGIDPEVAQHLPIPSPWRWHAPMVAKSLALALAIFAITEWWLLAMQFGPLHGTVCAVAIASLCAVIFSSVYGPWQERIAIFRRRNILGYTGMFWCEGGTLRLRPYENEKGWDGWTPNADPIRAIGPCPKCPPWKDEHRERSHRPYAMIPLGGLRSSFKHEYDADGGIYVAGKAGRRGVGWKIGFVGLASDGNDLLVTVTDPTGTMIRCSLRQAFTILTIVDELTPTVGLAGLFGALIAGALTGGPKPVTIGDAIAVMDRELHDVMTAHDAAAAEVARLKKEAEAQANAHRELEWHDAHAVELAMSVIEQLDASKATGRTIEWLCRKQDRLRDLLRILSETHFMRRRFTEMLAATEAAIAERDRTKVGQRQGAGSAPPA